MATQVDRYGPLLLLSPDMTRAVEPLCTTLDNGVTVISERLPGRRSVALSLTVGNGSRDQAPDENGFAHLLEHMLFKGSTERDGDALNAAMESLGGTINAFTDRESTVFHGTVLAEDAADAFTLLTELLTKPRFDHADLRLEKRVVAQEAAMAAEDVEDWAQERALAEIWGTHPLAWPVLGNARCIRSASRKRLQAYHQRILAESPLIITAVGEVEHGALCTWAQAAFRGRVGRARSAAPAPRFHGGQKRLRRAQAQQAHLIWMAPGCSVAAEDYLAHVVANAILGGGTASYLFRELREKRGLAYQVFSHLDPLRDCGEWTLYAAAPGAQHVQAAAAMAEVLAMLLEHGPTVADMIWAKRSLRIQLLLGQEDAEIRMSRLTRQWLYLGRLVPAEESLRTLAAVDADAVLRVLRKAWTERFEGLCLPARR
ncbi:insulinase family protein [Acidithiobacillus sp. 'AMD consortium']|uniref:Insulinase family protein n=2 Tax=Acidithiobacillus ferridurans TaxID=1232575 RepID=A0A8X8G907_ACIFI|nr:pitrilysin family protein [Acidithiobacillus ferridurans]QFG77597.1 insulinase family protein [Acidithiobacillus sp. 'AMD consortium']MBU2717401.1 insulinase family protein [Acidithiobacillus ferridurans]MBU2723569.1 insulinase family protein [Acidithiobacillus ferridurans]MBU2725818.1 insulinase family protein [Acidithiobacillus ferridurans]BBF65416.1 putative zinc protease [Acidithiobacillus ferridurans]